MISKPYNRKRSRVSPHRIGLVNAVCKGAERVEITISNDGETVLTDFHKWDVIVEYTHITRNSQDAEAPRADLHNSGVTRPSMRDKRTMRHFSFSRTRELSGGQWTIEEIIQQGVRGKTLNREECHPGDQIMLVLRLTPGAAKGIRHLATIVTPENTCISSGFTISSRR
ncbi:MAG: hypothetical protein SVM79_03670 [Chloroflexota bacterium]|nr:hypothetical protein [Chloroflexota bacterium]